MIDERAKRNVISGKFDFITPFYNQNHNNKSLIEGLDSLLSSYDLNVKSIPFSSERHPSKLFREISSKSRKIKILKKYDGIQLFQMTHSYKEGSETKEEKGDFFVYEHPEYNKIYVALTIESNNFFRRGILPFFENLYPHITMTFITHKKLRKLLEKFQIENQFSDLIVTRASHKFRLNEEGEGKNKKVFPAVSWPGMRLNEAFNWVYQNNGWFQSLQFTAKRRNFSAAEVSITRQGVVRATNLFSKVFESFVLPTCKTIHENIEFFGNRSRRYNRNLAAKPLAIDFGMDQFSNSSENMKFIQTLRSFNKASVSVLHGNPYIHLSVIDYFDGSTFDLWVLNSSHLVIVPQMKGSISSIKRLINHIFDTYAEGDIKDYQEILN
jgi:hypothetical protein